MRKKGTRVAKFNYAKGLTSADFSTKEEFYSQLSLLFERKVDDGEREAMLLFLSELVAIEEDPNDGSRQGRDTFGLQAFKVLVGLAQSLNIKEVFLRVLERRLAGILSQASPEFLTSVLPELAKILRHPRYGQGTIAILSRHTSQSKKQNAFTGNPPKTSQFARRLAELFEKIRRIDTDEERTTKRKTTVFEFMSLCATNRKMAGDFWELLKGGNGNDNGGKLSKILTGGVSDVKVNAVIARSAEIDLMANIARNFYIEPSGADSADELDDDEEASARPRRREYVAAKAFKAALDGVIKALEKQVSDDKATRPHQQGYQAALVSCISAILMRTAHVKAKGGAKVSKAKIPFLGYFIRLAKRPQANGRLLRACLDFLFNAVIKTPALSQYREVLETQMSFAVAVQTIVKNLITDMRKARNPNSEEQRALRLAVDVMDFYNEVSVYGETFADADKPRDKKALNALNLTIKFNVADVKGFDREEICFKILETPQDGTFSSEVTLSAARCLASVPIDQFSPGEIRRVVTILSRLSTSLTDSAYPICTHIIYLMTRLADQEDEEDSKEKVGQTFRNVYAAEVVATVFELLRRCTSKEFSPQDARHVDADQRACLSACVKYIMLAWRRLEMRDGMTTEANRSTFTQILTSEQALLKYAAPREFALHRHVLIEQTWLGADIESLLQVLESKAFRERDIVGFRLYHQIANVLEHRFLHSGRIPQFPKSEEEKLLPGATGHEERDGELDGGISPEDFLDLKPQGPQPTGGGQYSTGGEVSLYHDLCEAKKRGFDDWNRTRCGTLVTDMKKLEAMNLISTASTKTSRYLPVDIPPHTDKANFSATLEGITSLIFDYAKNVYRVKPQKLTDPKETKIKETVLEWIASANGPGKEVILIIYNPHAEGDEGGKGANKPGETAVRTRSVSALIHGGPVRVKRNDILIGRSGVFDPQDFAEVYHFYVDPQQGDIGMAQALLSEFSHRMREAGLEECLAWIHSEERAFFVTDNHKDVRRGEKMRSAQLRPNAIREQLANEEVMHALEAERESSAEGVAAKMRAFAGSMASMGAQFGALLAGGAAKASDEKQIILDNGEGDVSCPFLRIWPLERNVWQRNDAHAAFLERKGIEKMVQFLSWDPDAAEGQHLEEDEKSDRKHGEGKKEDDDDDSETEVGSGYTYRVRKSLESEEFGTELMLLLQHRDDEEGGVAALDDSQKRLLPGAGSGVPFADGKAGETRDFTELVMSHLINELGVEKRAIKVGPPAWSLFLSGTPEENFLCVKTVTPFPSAPPLPGSKIALLNPHAGPSHYFHTQPRTLARFDQPWRNRAVRLSRDPPSRLSEFEKKLAQEFKGWEARARNRYTLRNRRELLAEDMKPQRRAMAAALLRVLYTLMSRSSVSVRERTAAILQRPATFRRITGVLASFDYEIDASARARRPFTFACAQKCLLLTRTLTDISPGGHEACLAALEFYEVATDAVRGILMRLQRLVDSQALDNAPFIKRSLDFKAPSAVGAKRLTIADEELMATACAALEDTMREVLQLSFFKGKVAKIHLGNLKCRRRAIQALFLDDPAFVTALMTLLRYDTDVCMQGSVNQKTKQQLLEEKERGKKKKTTGESDEQEQWYSKCEPLDWMRIRVLSAISTLMVASESFTYQFFREYSTGSVKSCEGVRQSFIFDLMQASGREQLMSDLQVRMIQQDLLRKGENLEFVTFVQSEGTVRILALGNGQSFFQSVRPIDPEIPRNMSKRFVRNIPPGVWAELLNLRRMEYESVRGVFHGYGDQMFALCTSKGPVDWECQVMFTMAYGDGERVVDIFSRYCHDDLDRPLIDMPPPTWWLKDVPRAQQQVTPESESTGKSEKGGEAGGDRKLVSLGTGAQHPKRFFELALAELYYRCKSKLRYTDDKTVRDILYTYCRYNGQRHLIIWIAENDTPTARQWILICRTFDMQWQPQNQYTRPDLFFHLEDFIDLQDVKHLEFPDHPHAIMNVFHKASSKGSAKKAMFVFGCDTARQMWRRQATKYMQSASAEESERDFGLSDLSANTNDKTSTQVQRFV